MNNERERKFPGQRIPDPDEWEPGDTPALCAGTSVVETDWDIGAVIASLGEGVNPSGVKPGGADRETDGKTRSFYVRHSVSESLSRLAAVTPIAAAALRASDEGMTLSAVLSALSPLFEELPAEYREEAGMELLKGLHARGYVAMWRRAPDAEASQGTAGLTPEYSAMRAAASEMKQSLAHAE